MNSGFYAACTALLARTQQLELAANNLANVNTVGYRSQQVTFRSAFDGARRADNALNTAVNDFAVLGGSRVDVSSGNLEPTGNPLDFAIEGTGFFTVQTESGLAYTRNGRFRLSSERTLLTSNGDAVLGEHGSIQLPTGEMSVAADGTLSVDGAVAGRLQIIDFAAGTQLQAMGESYYVAPVGSSRPATGARVRQGSIEGSNVEPVSGAVGLIAIQRHAELLQRALSMFHSDLNRIAVEDLPRV